MKFTGPKRGRNHHQYCYYVPLVIIIIFFFFSRLSLLFIFSRNPYSHLNPKITVTKLSKQQQKQQSCQGKYVYIHDIPEKFNSDMLKDCKLLSVWTDMCLFTSNSGLGPELEISHEEEEDNLSFKTGCWYGTNQFALDVIFHNRMKQYRCLTNDSSLATAMFVPFYAGLDISRYLWGYNTSVRDSASSELVRWLRSRPEWQRMGGRDHFVVAGRITWDFRRLKDEEPNWGNKFLLTPEAKNMTTMVVESSPWHNNDVGIPYPTYFHPSKVSEVRTWQEKMRGKRRKWLFSFAGAPRPNDTVSIRGMIIDQCRSSSVCSLLQCGFGASRCHSPTSVMRLFQSSIFCLQPQGDSYTRRSAFDAMLSGCIPVFFHPGSAYTQYIWHLQRDYSRYSVFISEEDVREGKGKTIEQVLEDIDEKKVVAMREEVIRMIPRLIYADPRSNLHGIKDAVDVAVEGVIGIVEELRKEIREGGVKSREFQEQNSWKYRLVGNEDPHEWDHFFFKPSLEYGVESQYLIFPAKKIQTGTGIADLSE